MEIINRKTNNPEIEIVTLFGGITGSGAIELQDYLYKCLDQGRCNQLMNLKCVEKIDGLGIKVICDLVNRGILIGMFNVGAEIRMMFRMDKKENAVKVYNEPCSDKVVSLFEKDMLETKVHAKNRMYARYSIDHAVEFKYHSEENREVLTKAKALNLSEAGLFVNHIVLIDPENVEALTKPIITGKDLYEINLKLDDGHVVKAKGTCVREVIYGENLSVGIQFKQMSESNRNLIREFINIQRNLNDDCTATYEQNLSHI